MPFAAQIQRSFGRHDLSGLRAHTGSAAQEAAGEIGAEAYATGSDVAFAGTPDLHTAAHEAAHVVQQRSGVSLSGGVGAEGDVYERHADAVADRVVRGESAESLLDAHAPGGGGGVPRKGLPAWVTEALSQAQSVSPKEGDGNKGEKKGPDRESSGGKTKGDDKDERAKSSAGARQAVRAEAEGAKQGGGPTAGAGGHREAAPGSPEAQREKHAQGPAQGDARAGGSGGKHAPTGGVQRRAVQRKNVQREPVRQGTTTVSSNTDWAFEHGNEKAAQQRSRGAGQSLSIGSDIRDAAALIGILREHTANLRQGAAVETLHAGFYNGKAASNDAVIQALGQFHHAAAATTVDVTMFEGSYDNLNVDFARLQGMMSAFHARHPGAGGTGIPQNGEQAGKEVAGGVTETDVNRTVEGIPDAGVKRGLDKRIDKVETTLRALQDGDGSPAQVAAASAGVSAATRQMLTGAMEVRLGPAKREDDPNHDKELVAARATVTKVNAELASATTQVGAISSAVQAGIKAAGGGTFLDAVSNIKNGVSSLHPELAAALDSKKLTADLTKALTGLGNKLDNAKGMLAGYEGDKANFNIIHHLSKWDSAKVGLEAKAKAFSTQIAQQVAKRKAVIAAVMALDTYTKEHKIKGPKGRDIALLAGMLAAAQLFVAQADTAEGIGSTTAERIHDALGHEAQNTVTDQAGTRQQGTGDAWAQARARETDPLTGKPGDWVDVPGRLTREIQWWSCVRAQKGGTKNSPEYAFTARPQTSKLHAARDGGKDEQHLVLVQRDVDRMLGSIFVSRATVTDFAKVLAATLGFAGLHK
jgi:hypothetical protein